MNRRRPAFFLDRDGVINKDTGYPYRPSDLHFIPGAPEAIARMNTLGYLVIVITNQSGVARGYFTEEEVNQFHQCITIQLQSYQAHINAFYICPFHPQGTIESYKKEHFDRKPNPGMVEKAIAEFNVDRDRSILIGDKHTDLLAGHQAHIDSYLFDKNNLDHFVMSVMENRWP